MNSRHFHAPWGRALLITSVAVTVILLAVSGFALWRTGDSRPLLWLSLLMLGAAPFVVRGYQLQGRCLLIKRLFWSTKIPLDGLVSATSDSRAMRGSIRTFGNGGLYSISGWYWSRRLGAYRAFVTDMNRTVVLRFQNRTIVISPAEPDSFVAAVAEIIGTAPAVATPAQTAAMTH
jgi:hypothetical protein